MSRTFKLAMVAVLAASPMVMAAPSAEAAPSASKYKNCTALNRAYPNGVGRKGAVDKTKGTRVRNFRVDTKLYNSLPKTLDRDRDGIACEKLTKSAPAKPKQKPAGQAQARAHQKASRGKDPELSRRFRLCCAERQRHLCGRPDGRPVRYQPVRLRSADSPPLVRARLRADLRPPSQRDAGLCR